MKLFLSVLCACLLPLAVFAQDVPDSPVGENWGSYGINWSDGSELYLRYGVKDHNGQIAVCVAVTSRRSIPRNLIQEALRQGRVVTNGDTAVVRDLRFGRVYSSRYRNGELVGEAAHCKVSNVVSQAGLSFQMVFPNGRYTFQK